MDVLSYFVLLSPSSSSTRQAWGRCGSYTTYRVWDSTYMSERERGCVCDSLDYLPLTLTDRCDETNRRVCICACVCLQVNTLLGPELTEVMEVMGEIWSSGAEKWRLHLQRARLLHRRGRNHVGLLELERGFPQKESHMTHFTTKVSQMKNVSCASCMLNPIRAVRSESPVCPCPLPGWRPRGAPVCVCAWQQEQD